MVSEKIPVITATDAAAMIGHGDIIGFSGFTPAGAAKEIPKAIAHKATAEHEAGRPFKVGVVTGASDGKTLAFVGLERPALSRRPHPTTCQRSA